jgi:hypothetical protein
MTESFTEVQEVLPDSWRWRPVVGQNTTAMLRRSVEKGLPDSAARSIEREAVEILGRCLPPSIESGSSTGLIVGYVQSGKTFSFTTLTTLARDNGYPLVIVLSGTKKNLTDQTSKRLRRDLDIDDFPGPWRLIEAQTKDSSLAATLRGLVEEWRDPDSTDAERQTAVISVLKNRQRIESTAQALESLDLNGLKCLIIDDEADQAGLNTMVNQNDSSSVYRSINRLRTSLPHHTFLQYTATPQANLLISVVDTLSPEFGWVLKPGETYTGGEVFFDESSGLVNVIPDQDLEEHGNELPAEDGPPGSLKQALAHFVIGMSNHRSRTSRRLTDEHWRSMLIHPSITQIDQAKYKRWIDALKETWLDLLGDEFDPDRVQLLMFFRDVYESIVRCSSDKTNSEHIEPFDDLTKHFSRVLRHCVTHEVNSRNGVPRWNHENWAQSAYHILVGGENLGRGFTVEGLTTTYMPRGRGQGTADTIQQRARFFGYKRPYLGLCRVYLTSDVRDDYANYVEHETFVMDELKQMVRQDVPFREWRRRMILASSLHPTRRSVVPNDIYRHSKVSEWTTQSFPHLVDQRVHPSNAALLDELVASCSWEEPDHHPDRTPGTRHSYSSPIALDHLLGMLDEFQLSNNDRAIISPLEVVLQHHLSANPDSHVIFVRIAGTRQNVENGNARRPRSVGKNGQVDLLQGPSPRGPHVYAGDRNEHSSSSITVQIHNLDFQLPGADTSIQVPTLAIWTPPNVRRSVFLE